MTVNTSSSVPRCLARSSLLLTITWWMESLSICSLAGAYQNSAVMAIIWSKHTEGVAHVHPIMTWPFQMVWTCAIPMLSCGLSLAKLDPCVLKSAFTRLAHVMVKLTFCIQVQKILSYTHGKELCKTPPVTHEKELCKTPPVPHEKEHICINPS